MAMLTVRKTRTKAWFTPSDSVTVKKIRGAAHQYCGYSDGVARCEQARLKFMGIRRLTTVMTVNEKVIVLRGGR